MYNSESPQSLQLINAMEIKQKHKVSFWKNSIYLGFSTVKADFAFRNDIKALYSSAKKARSYFHLALVQLIKCLSCQLKLETEWWKILSLKNFLRESEKSSFSR